MEKSRRNGLERLKDYPKKLWRKTFSEEELNEIFNAAIESTNEVFDIPSKEWYVMKTKKIIEKYGFLMHLETDRFDDLTGIRPETIKEYLKDHNINDFKQSLNKINIYLKIVPESYLRQSRILSFDNTDGILSLECDYSFRNLTIYKEEAESQLLKEISIFFGGDNELLGTDFWNNWKDYLKTKNDIIVFRKILSKMNIDIGNFVEKGVDVIIEKREEQWKKIFKRVPQVKELVLVNPENFDFREHTKVINDVYGQQLKDLPEDDRKIICQAIDSLGKNLNTSFLATFKNKKVVFNYFQNKMLEGEKVPLVSDELSTLNGFSELDNIEKIHCVLRAAKLKRKNIVAFEKIINSWKKRKNLKKSIQMLSRILNYMASNNYNDTIINTVAKIEDPYSFFKILNRYTKGNVLNPFSEELIKLMDIYNKRISEQNIPIVSGKIGEYSYEILQKDDPTGLVLGYATDCCQTAYGAGASCISYGYNNSDSGFFKVEKKNTIYAQSWIWQIEKELNEKNLKILVFDSIEFLGDDLNQYAIIPAYEETARKLISEYGYDLVIAVSSPNIGLDNVPWPVHTFRFFDSSDFSGNGYFDFNGRGHILGISKNIKGVIKNESDVIYKELKNKHLILE